MQSFDDLLPTIEKLAVDGRDGHKYLVGDNGAITRLEDVLGAARSWLSEKNVGAEEFGRYAGSFDPKGQDGLAAIGDTVGRLRRQANNRL